MKQATSSVYRGQANRRTFTSEWHNLVLGFQHLLAMYSGDVLVPLLIGHYLHFSALQMTYLVSIDIFMCGVATLLQLKQTPLTGIGLPVVLGCAVQAVTPLESIGGKLGITYMYGAIIAAGIFVFLIAGFFARLKRFFPPVVTGSLITIIGFTLVPVGFQDLGGRRFVREPNEPVSRLFDDYYHPSHQRLCPRLHEVNRHSDWNPSGFIYRRWPRPGIVNPG